MGRCPAGPVFQHHGLHSGCSGALGGLNTLIFPLFASQHCVLGHVPTPGGVHFSMASHAVRACKPLLHLRSKQSPYRAWADHG